MALLRSLLLLVVLALALPDVGWAAEDRWEPAKTRVFLVSMTSFDGGVGSPWGTRGRLDRDLVRLLKVRGVPESQLVFLTDEGARRADVERAFVTLLRGSRAGETLIFDFSSHGGYDPKTQRFTYSAFDGGMSFEWFFDAIERDFKGAKVLMLADCCYSGGIVEIARRRQGRVAYACLSSTYAHNLGFSGWRFFDCLIRGFGGSPVVDLDGDGRIELDELARFTEKHMAFVAEGHPMFLTTGGFDPRMSIADASGPRKPAPVGQYVEALHDGQWRKAEIVDAAAGRLRVHFTDERINTVVWHPRGEVRPFEFPHFAAGAAVEVSRDGWDRARVKEGQGPLYLCAIDGLGSPYDEWVGPSRLRSAAPLVAASGWTGTWRGKYRNSTGQSGEDAIVLREDTEGNLTGTWSGDVSLRGRRDGDTARLSGRTAKRDYVLTATLGRGVLTMRYTARRLDSGGTYSGTVTLTRVR